MEDALATLNSALFVDFDNIYSRIFNDHGKELAESFATNPGQWLDWLTQNEFFQGGRRVTRDILVRKCYFNPAAFYYYRPFFVTSAFNVVDCPPLTKGGKTSADIHMVLDIIDALENDSPIYDEFIIFSGDADFTPVLIRLREKGRKTIVLAVGATSPAYRSAASTLIGEDQFVEEALNFYLIEQSRSPAKNTESLKNEIGEFIVETVNKSSEPMVMATLADRIRREFAELDLNDWFGEGKFRDFLTSIDLKGLALSSVIPGYAYNPNLHTLPEADEGPSQFEKDDPDLFEFAKYVHSITDTPLVTPACYKFVFELLADEIAENGFNLTMTSKNLRDRCIEKDVHLSRQQANFILIGLSKVGYRYKWNGKDTPADLAKAFAKNVFDLCISSQMSLKEKDMDRLLRWIMPKG